MIQEARQGGSITPGYRKALDEHIKRGRLSLRTHTKLVQKIWDPQTHTWTVQTEPPIDGLPGVDYIYYATQTVNIAANYRSNLN